MWFSGPHTVGAENYDSRFFGKRHWLTISTTSSAQRSRHVLPSLIFSNITPQLNKLRQVIVPLPMIKLPPTGWLIHQSHRILLFDELCSFRRTFASILAKRELDNRHITRLGRWESIQMVEIYTRSVSFEDSLRFYRSQLG